MSNELIKKEIQTKLGTATLTIYPEAKLAIEKGWESLYFADNIDTFATIELGKHLVVLETNGEVRIKEDDENSKREYRNKDVKDIRLLLDEDRLENLMVDDNNWFTVTVGSIVGREGELIKSEMLDDCVFEACPESLEELESTFMDYATDMIGHVA